MFALYKEDNDISLEEALTTLSKLNGLSNAINDFAVKPEAVTLESANKLENYLKDTKEYLQSIGEKELLSSIEELVHENSVVEYVKKAWKAFLKVLKRIGKELKKLYKKTKNLISSLFSTSETQMVTDLINLKDSDVYDGVAKSVNIIANVYNKIDKVIKVDTKGISDKDKDYLKVHGVTESDIAVLEDTGKSLIIKDGALTLNLLPDGYSLVNKDNKVLLKEDTTDLLFKRDRNKLIQTTAKVEEVFTVDTLELIYNTPMPPEVRGEMGGRMHFTIEKLLSSNYDMLLPIAEEVVEPFIKELDSKLFNVYDVPDRLINTMTYLGNLEVPVNKMLFNIDTELRKVEGGYTLLKSYDTYLKGYSHDETINLNIDHFSSAKEYEENFKAVKILDVMFTDIELQIEECFLKLMQATETVEDNNPTSEFLDIMKKAEKVLTHFANYKVTAAKYCDMKNRMTKEFLVYKHTASMNTKIFENFKELSKEEKEIKLINNIVNLDSTDKKDRNLLDEILKLEKGNTKIKSIIEDKIRVEEK